MRKGLLLGISFVVVMSAAIVHAQIAGPGAIAMSKGTGPESATISGTVSFQQVDKDLAVSVSLQNVPPGKHGFHIHEKAHSGDMGNIDIAEDGTGKLELTLPEVSLNDISGLAVILHEKVDDFGQPTGNAGGRIGCGIITPIQALPEKVAAPKMEPDEMGSMHDQMNATK